MNLTEETIKVYNQIAERFDMHIRIMSTYGVGVPNPSHKQWQVPSLMSRIYAAPLAGEVS